MGITVKVTKRKLLAAIGAVGGGLYFIPSSEEKNNNNPNPNSRNQDTPPEFWGEKKEFTIEEGGTQTDFEIEHAGPTIFNLEITADDNYAISLSNTITSYVTNIATGEEDTTTETIQNLRRNEYIPLLKGGASKCEFEVMDYPIVNENNNNVVTPPINTNSDQSNIFGPIYFPPNAPTAFELTPEQPGQYRLIGYDETGTQLLKMIDVSIESETELETIQEEFNIYGIGYFQIISEGGWSLDIQTSDIDTDNKDTDQNTTKPITTTDLQMTITDQTATISGKVSNNRDEVTDPLDLYIQIYDSEGNRINSRVKPIDQLAPNENESFVQDMDTLGVEINDYKVTLGNASKIENTSKQS